MQYVPPSAFTGVGLRSAGRFLPLPIVDAVSSTLLFRSFAGSELSELMPLNDVFGISIECLERLSLV